MSNDTESEGEHDPLEYVPDWIDAITVDESVAIHEALNEENTAKLESMPIEDQGITL